MNTFTFIKRIPEVFPKKLANDKFIFCEPDRIIGGNRHIWLSLPYDGEKIGTFRHTGEKTITLLKKPSFKDGLSPYETKIDLWETNYTYRRGKCYCTYVNSVGNKKHFQIKYIRLLREVARSFPDVEAYITSFTTNSYITIPVVLLYQKDTVVAMLAGLNL